MPAWKVIKQYRYNNGCNENDKCFVNGLEHYLQEIHWKIQLHVAIMGAMRMISILDYLN